MLSCNLDRNSKTALYEQLYQYIKKEIMKGKIPYQTKLPSKRKLSEFLKVSQNTVEQAYDQLVAEGYVEGIARKGYFVLAYEDLEYVQSKNRIKINSEKLQANYRYNFHPSRIDTENFPFAKWRKYTRNVVDVKHQSLLQMGNRQGEYLLREEIANYLFQARGVHCTSDQIIVGAGVEVLLQQLILLLGNQVVYGVEDPGYHVISRILKYHPNKVVPLKVDEQGVIVDNLDQSIVDILYITPSHHFPYGSVLSANRRIKLLNWAANAENRYIIEDDYNSEFRYSGKSIPSLQSMDHSEKVIYLGTFSKSLIPSIRISYMILPKELMILYKKQLSFFQCTVSRIDQYVLGQFMKDGEFEKHLNRMRKVYRRKMEKTLTLLKPYEKQLSIINDLSGFHIVLHVKNGMSERELMARAEEANIHINPLSTYIMDKKRDSQPIFILGFAGISEDELEEAINLLLKSWDIN